MDLQQIDDLNPEAPERSVTVPSDRVWPQVTGAIVGASTQRQVDGWLPAADLSLTGSDLDVIATAIEESGAGRGPARPPHQVRTTST